MLLALCSKNNEEDVFETFRAHPEMPLRLEDFAAHRINWESKAVNLAVARRRTRARPRQLHPGGRQPQGVQRGPGRRARGSGPAAARPARRDSRLSWRMCGPSTAPASPRKTGAGPNSTPSAPNGLARSAPPAASEEFLASLELEVRIAPLRAGAGRPRRPAHPAHQPDERHAACGAPRPKSRRSRRECLTRRRERPLRQLRTHRAPWSFAWQATRWWSIRSC